MAKLSSPSGRARKRWKRENRDKVPHGDGLGSVMPMLPSREVESRQQNVLPRPTNQQADMMELGARVGRQQERRTLFSQLFASLSDPKNENNIALAPRRARRRVARRLSHKVYRGEVSKQPPVPKAA